MSPSPTLLLRVAAAWPLPGLGLLALPEGPTPYLASQPLHTALAVVLHLPNGSSYSGQSTVEELSRPEEPSPVQGLLLDLDGSYEVPPGTTIWLAQQPPAFP